MDQSFPLTEWKPQATAEKHSQVPALGPESALALLEVAVLSMVTFNGALNEAAKHSGKEDWQIADAIHISHGYMSRFMRGVGQQWAKRLVAFMRETRSVAPLQWLAHQMGCEVVLQDRRAAEVAALKARLRELGGQHA